MTTRKTRDGLRKPCQLCHGESGVVPGKCLSEKSLCARVHVCMRVRMYVCMPLSPEGNPTGHLGDRMLTKYYLDKVAHGRKGLRPLHEDTH